MLTKFGFPMTRSPLFCLITASALALSASTSFATTISFTVDAMFMTIDIFGGEFDATDIDGNGVIDSSIDTINWFDAQVGQTNAWNQRATSGSTQSFFDVFYDGDGIIGNDANEFLRFGYDGFQSCEVHFGGGTPLVDVGFVASLKSIVLPPAFDGYLCPLPGRERYEIFSGSLLAYTSDFPSGFSASAVPLPPSLPFLGMALGMLAIGRPTRRHFKRVERSAGLAARR